MVSIVKTINGQKKLIPLTSDVGSGVPLGTLVAFSDDTPKDGYVQMGTTFDETKYPALYALLGSNQIPAMFDHSRPSDYETISTTGFSPWTAPYDAVLIYCGDAVISVNGEIICISTTGTNKANTLEVKKGDVVTLSSPGSQLQIKVAYYKHPLFIKATSGLAENQQENVLNTLNNNLSYSTEEHATGRKWIDGKMIYRKCYIETNAGDWSNNQTIDTIANFETYVGSCLNALFQGTRNTYFSNMMIDSGRGLIAANASGEIKVNLSGTINTVKKWGWIEYTKTTDYAGTR